MPVHLAKVKRAMVGDVVRQVINWRRRMLRVRAFGEVPGCGLGMPARLLADVVRQATFFFVDARLAPPLCDGLLINWRRRMLRVRPICTVQQRHDEQCSGGPHELWTYRLKGVVGTNEPGFTCRKQVVVGGGGTRARACVLVRVRAVVQKVPQRPRRPAQK